MSIGQPGLDVEDPLIQRVQTRGDLELLDRGIYVPEIKVDPTAPISCGNQIWVQSYRPRGEGCALLDLTHYDSERSSGQYKHRWVVFIEFERPPREPPGLSYLLGNSIDSPAESFPLYIATSAERVRCGEFGIDTVGNFGELERFDVRFTGEPINASERAKIIVVGLKAFGRFALRALDFGAFKLRRDCADHVHGEPILQIENIIELAVEPVGPEMRSCCGIDELSRDTNAIAGLAHTAFEH